MERVKRILKALKRSFLEFLPDFIILLAAAAVLHIATLLIFDHFDAEPWGFGVTGWIVLSFWFLSDLCKK